MNDSDYILLVTIKERCKKGDGFLAHIINAATDGLEEAGKESRQRAADMEIFAVATLTLVKEARVSPKLKEQMSQLALSKMSKHIGKTSCRWDSDIKPLGE